MKDTHVHTNISHDGVSSAEEYLDIAKEKNVDEITFTEHYDIYDGIDTELKTSDVDKYEKKFSFIKDNTKVKTNFGIEIGLQPDIETYTKIRNMLRNYSFDYVIGATHIFRKIDISKNPSSFKNKTPQEINEIYLNEVLKSLNLYYYEFDVVAHLDYIIRYTDKQRLNIKDYQDIIDTILKTLIRKDKGLEVNTSGIRYGLKDPHPNIDIVKRYKEFGGKIITIGSDAHQAKDLASNFIEVCYMLESIGVDEVAIYHHRRPDFVKIKSLY